MMEDEGEEGVLLASKEALLIGHRGAEVPCMTNGSSEMDEDSKDAQLRLHAHL